MLSRYAKTHLKTDLSCADSNLSEFIPVTGAHKLHGVFLADFSVELSA